MGPNRTPQQVISTGVDGTTPYLRVICGTSASYPFGGLWIPGIVNKLQSDSPNFWKSDEFDGAVDGNFSNNLIAPPVITQVFSDKLSNSSIRYIYARCGMHLTTGPVNPVTSQFVTHGFSTANALNKGAEILIPDTRVRRSSYVTHWSASDNYVAQNAAVGDAVETKSDYSKENYKTDFEIWRVNNKIQFKRKIFKGVDQIGN